MTLVPKIAVALLTMSILALAPPARADVIRITSGGMDAIGSQGGFVNIQSADHGFSLNASGSTSGGIFRLADCNFAPECTPGTRLSLDATWSGSDFTGTVTIDGQTYGIDMGTSTTGSALVLFTGTWKAPQFTGAETATARAPFLFRGHFSYPDSIGGGHDLRGHGFATIGLRWNSTWQAWQHTQSRYEFGGASSAATPEPATLLLVAPFAAALARKRLTRAARS